MTFGLENWYKTTNFVYCEWIGFKITFHWAISLEIYAHSASQTNSIEVKEWWMCGRGSIVEKGIKFNVKHINRHFYSGTHIPKTYTHYIQWLIFAKKGNRKIERFMLLFYYNFNSVVKNGSQVGKSVFLIFIFTFYLRQIKSHFVLLCLVRSMQDIMSLAFIVVFFCLKM